MDTELTSAPNESCLAAYSQLSQAVTDTARAQAYGLTCFHNYNYYFAKRGLEEVMSARIHLEKAEALFKSALDASDKEEVTNEEAPPW